MACRIWGYENREAPLRIVCPPGSDANIEYKVGNRAGTSCAGAPPAGVYLDTYTNLPGCLWSSADFSGPCMSFVRHASDTHPVPTAAGRDPVDDVAALSQESDAEENSLSCPAVFQLVLLAWLPFFSFPLVRCSRSLLYL
jgi:hypothetical protein